MVLDGGSIIAYIVGLTFIFLLGWLFIKPLKWLLRLVLNSVLGGVILVVTNALGGFLGLTVSVNVFTALTVGALGLPGLILLYVLQIIL